MRDVGSLNGTYVNRERIEEAELTGGDEVQIGKFRLVFLPAARRRRPPAAEGAASGRCSAQPATAARLAGIGEVLAQLRAEFPDVSMSKIRFLEAEGLIEPAAVTVRYRGSAAADIERLRYILTAQRDQYLPLRVIRDRLDAGPRAEAADGQPAGGPGGRRLTRRQLLDAAGIGDGATLTELEDFGLARGQSCGLLRRGRRYGAEAPRSRRAAPSCAR